MIQCCDVYINILCDEEEKMTISEWLKNYFNKKENMNIWGASLNYLDIIDNAKGLIVLDLEVDNPCDYIGGYPGSRWEPPEPAYIFNNLDEIDFLDWIKEIISDNFDVEIEIDKDSKIPSEKELVKDFEEKEEYRYEEY